MEVHVASVHFRGSMWESKLSSVTEVRFTMNRIILDCKSPSYNETFTLGLIRSSPSGFSLGTIVS